MEKQTFSIEQIVTVHKAAEQAEEIVSGFYKMSASQWLRNRFEIKTYNELSNVEKIDGPFAQIVKYSGQRKNSSLGSEVFDLYRICIQDAAVLNLLSQEPQIQLHPFLLYILSHELIHVIRFGKFQQFFHAGIQERVQEEQLVHRITRDLLIKKKLSGIASVLAYYEHAAI